MPRHAQGDKAMTGAKRQRLWRERLRQAKPPSVKLAREAAKAVQTSVSASSQALIEARQEIERLRAQLAAASKAARAADAEQIRLHMENTRLRKLLADSRKAEPEQVAELRRRIERLQADHARRDAAAKAAKTQAAKPVSPVDPDSEVVRLKAIMAYNAWRADRRRATDDR